MASGTVDVAVGSIPSGDVGKYLKVMATADGYTGYVDHWSLDGDGNPRSQGR